jgi:hypothetical protein
MWICQVDFKIKKIPRGPATSIFCPVTNHGVSPGSKTKIIFNCKGAFSNFFFAGGIAELAYIAGVTTI